VPKRLTGTGSKRAIVKLWSDYSDGQLSPEEHLSQYGYPPQWDGKLYRAGDPAGIYYHVAGSGAQYYAAATGEPVEAYPYPDFKQVLFIDLDEDAEWIDRQLRGKSTGDVGLDLEELMPALRERGFDGVLLHGETGADVAGPSIEVVDLTKWRPGPNQIADMMN